MMKLVLKSNITKKSWEFEVEDSNDSRLFYHFTAFTLTQKMDEGEYEYTLYDEEDNNWVEVACGLLQIGDYKPENNKTYTKQENGYKQYQG